MSTPPSLPPRSLPFSPRPRPPPPSQEETQLKLPMPHGSIISEADAWAAAAAAGAGEGAALSDEEEGQPPPTPPPLYVSDGLTVSFSANGNDTRGADPCEQRRRSKEHSGRFGRWGLEVREQWSCCLWDEAGAWEDSGGDDAGYLGADSIPADGGGGGGGGGRRSRRRRSGAAGGCEAVPPRPDPGGMTTADDVHLVWGPSQRNSGGAGNGSVNTGVDGSTTRLEAWGASGGGFEERELWRPILASKISGCTGGAAWSLIRHRGRRPRTANARLAGRGAPATATAPSGGGSNGAKAPSEKGVITAGLRNGGSGVVAGAVRNRGDGSQRRPLGSSRPGSAPPTWTGKASRHNQLHPQNRVNRHSSLASLRRARARAGWQRTCPPPASGGGGGGSGAAFRRDPPGSSGALRPKSAVGLSKSWSTYSVYSKGDGRKPPPPSAAGGGGAPPRGGGSENGDARRP